MSSFDEYMEQSGFSSTSSSSHYDQHTDRWVDEAGESVFGHSGHCDSHTDSD